MYVQRACGECMYVYYILVYMSCRGSKSVFVEFLNPSELQLKILIILTVIRQLPFKFFFFTN